MLSPKNPAPAFALPSTSGRTVSTKDLRGRRFVLYFYPRDDTPGCTREACDFRDNLARLGSAGVAVYGVSKDSLASHLKFQAKHGIPFELLSDEGHAVARAYGAFGEKLMYGKPVVGVIRSTFLIGADGRVERVWSPVKVEGHVDAVLAAIREGAAMAGGKDASYAARAATIVPPRAAMAKAPAGSKPAGAKKAAVRIAGSKAAGAKDASPRATTAKRAAPAGRRAPKSASAKGPVARKAGTSPR